MSTSLKSRWPDIRALWKRTLVYPIASVGPEGSPHVTPIGSVWLHPTEPRGCYLERFPTNLPRNLDRDPRFTLLMVDTGATFWIRSLLRGRFERPVGMRLTGSAGPRRPSTDKERERFLRRVRPLRWTRGHGMLWGNDAMAHARDLHFDAALPIRLGAMTAA